MLCSIPRPKHPSPGIARRFRAARCILSAALILANAQEATAELSPCAARPPTSYALKVTLDPEHHTLNGSGRLSLRNSSRHSISELYLHLYLNAFKNDTSLWFRAAAGTSRDPRSPLQGGRVDVVSFKAVDTGHDLWPAHEIHSAPGTQDETDVRLPLPTGLAPGEFGQWDVEWQVQLPRLTERTGYEGDFHFLGQWFPKFAKLETDGTFAHFPFDPRAEFYADFGTYDVEVTLPQQYVVGASGQIVSSSSDGKGLKSVRFKAAAVHDFAWTAWPSFVEMQRNIAGVSVRVLHPPGYAQAAEQSLTALEFAFPYFAERYGPYPYPTLTVVHPPDEAGGAMGMEYPTLIVTGGKWQQALDWNLYRARSIELVTLHELAHQWFYGVLASNEMLWPFLDEAFASFAETAAAEAWLGNESHERWPGFQISAASSQRLDSIELGRSFPIAQAAASFPRFSDIAAVVYGRGSTLLETWRRVYGAPFEGALRNYALQFRCQHPTPEDLLQHIGAVLGEQAAQSLRLALFERGSVDYRVEHVESQVEPRRDMSSPAYETRYRNRITIVREGTLSFPVDVEWLDASGQTTVNRWDGQDTFVTYETVTLSPIVNVWVDRQRHVLLDDNLLNNARAQSPSFGLLILESLAFWMGVALNWIGP